MLLQTADLMLWTSTVLRQNGMQGCKAEELLAVLQTRDEEEVLILSRDEEHAACFL